MKYKFIEHTADIQFQAFGKTIEEAFSNSALAMTKSITDETIDTKIEKKIAVSGHDRESLLYNFLEELLLLFDSEHFIFAKVSEIKIEDNELTATILGDLAEGYEIHLDIKAITYNEMFVRLQQDIWTTQVTLDV